MPLIQHQSRRFDRLRPTRSEVVSLLLILGMAVAVIIGALLGGCASPTAGAGQASKNETQLQNVQDARESIASAGVEVVSVETLKAAAMPDAPPIVKATSITLEAPRAALPPPTDADLKTAQAIFDNAMGGNIADAQAAADKEKSRANALQKQVSTLQTQVAADRASNEAVARRAQVAIWQARMMGVGIALFLLAAGLVAAEVFTGIEGLRRVAVVAGGFAILALFSAYEAGTPMFDKLAFVTVAGAVVCVLYAGYKGFQGGKEIKTQSAVADATAAGIQTFVDDTGSEAGKLLGHLRTAFADAPKEAVTLLKEVEAKVRSAETPAPVESVGTDNIHELHNLV